MKFLLFSLFTIFCVSGVFGQSDFKPRADPSLDESLLIYIIEAEEIYHMSDTNRWRCVVGNRQDKLRPVKGFRSLISEDQEQEPFFDAECNFDKKMRESGNLFLAFSEKNRAARYFVMNKHKANMVDWLVAGKRKHDFPKLPTLQDDLIQLCKLKLFITMLSKGGLTAKDYRFSIREWALLMRLCPDDWGHHLVSYAVSDNYPGEYLVESDYLKTLMDSLNQGEKFMEKHPYLDGVDSVKKFYAALVVRDIVYMRDTLDEHYALVLQKIEKIKTLNVKDRMLIKVLLGKEDLNNKKLKGNGELGCLRKYIIKNKDLELLKVYLQRVETRQSVADIPVLGQFLQSDLYLKGSSDFRNAILDQCALRKEKEIVWLLANSDALPRSGEDSPIVELSLQRTKDRAKEMMVKMVGEDLGNDPKAWKKWYRD